MNKVVVERPRGGSSNPSRKWGKRLAYIPDCDYEDEPKHISSSRRRQYASPKWFTDVLNPLERFLQKNIGRPWDKVYSELRSGLDVRKVTGLHIFQHLEQMVDLSCFEDEDGRVCSYNRFRWMVYGYLEVEGLYVHPRTRLLQFAPRANRTERRQQYLQKKEVVGFWIDKTRAYRLLNDIWYVVTYKRVSLPRRPYGKSFVCLPQMWGAVQRAKVRLYDGENLIAVQKKQCSHEEVVQVQALTAQWERSLRQRNYKLDPSVRAILK
jgi:hypothetical protein